MTVQELINALSKVEDKNQKVYIVTTNVFGESVYSNGTVSEDPDKNTIIYTYPEF